jgi:hypothetical protein
VLGEAEGRIEQKVGYGKLKARQEIKDHFWEPAIFDRRIKGLWKKNIGLRICPTDGNFYLEQQVWPWRQYCLLIDRILRPISIDVGGSK